MHQLNVLLGKLNILLQFRGVIFVKLGVRTVADELNGTVLESLADFFSLGLGELRLHAVRMFGAKLDSGNGCFFAYAKQRGEVHILAPQIRYQTKFHGRRRRVFVRENFGVHGQRGCGSANGRFKKVTSILILRIHVESLRIGKANSLAYQRNAIAGRCVRRPNANAATDIAQIHDSSCSSRNVTQTTVAASGNPRGKDGPSWGDSSIRPLIFHSETLTKP